ncbi:MAG: patatin [Alteromonadaceae bacterium]|nr:MAG: patatin [Alteromonadaceae bacterium]
MSTNALILSGGGARAAYQVGVLQAVSDILPALDNPFPIICGTSAGAINAAAMAAHPGSFRQASRDLANTWNSLEVNHVFKTGWGAMLSGLGQAGASLFHEGLVGGGKSVALLDNSPLRGKIEEFIPFANIQRRVDQGVLRALSITALGYSSGESVSFFQGAPDLEGWRRFRRVGTPEKITVEHLLASSAIPAVFPAVCLNHEFFGDGAMRQMAPISSALHLGADRVFVIGVSGNRHAAAHWKYRKKVPSKRPPSIAQVLGQMFNSAFIDSLEGDIEHLERANTLLNCIPEREREELKPLRPVDTLIISPSKPLDKIAGRQIRNLPRSLRFFLGATGATARGDGSAVASYLLFAHEYCHELMELGYQDAMWERDSIESFFANTSKDK